MQSAKTSRLHFEVDGVDLDQQDKRATQKLIDERFNTPLLRHAVFYGQNDITSILEVQCIGLMQRHIPPG